METWFIRSCWKKIREDQSCQIRRAISWRKFRESAEIELYFGNYLVALNYVKSDFSQFDEFSPLSFHLIEYSRMEWIFQGNLNPKLMLCSKFCFTCSLIFNRYLVLIQRLINQNGHFMRLASVFAACKHLSSFAVRIRLERFHGLALISRIQTRRRLRRQRFHSFLITYFFIILFRCVLNIF